MALVAADLAYFPARPGILSTGGTTMFTFDASTDFMALVFQIPKSGTIDNVHYRTGATSSPVGTSRLEMRTVDTATGKPNAAGTLYGSSSSITKDASTYSANTNYTAAVNATAVAGDWAAIVMDVSAWTSGSFEIVHRSTYLGDPISTGICSVGPYGVRNVSASDIVEDRPPMGFALEYASGGLTPITGYYSWVGTTAIIAVTNSGVTRRGNTFTPATPRRAIGIYAHVNFASAGTGVLRLWLASDDSVLATHTLDKDIRGIASHGYYHGMFDSGDSVTLAAGTEYYLTLEGTDASGFGIAYLLNGPTGSATLTPGGANCFGVTYSGSYTEVDTSYYFIGLITDQEDDGAGGGGGLITHPGMSGGMRG